MLVEKFELCIRLLKEITESCSLMINNETCAVLCLNIKLCHTYDLNFQKKTSFDNLEKNKQIELFGDLKKKEVLGHYL